MFNTVNLYLEDESIQTNICYKKLWKNEIKSIVLFSIL